MAETIDDLWADEFLTPEQAAAGFAAQLQQPAFEIQDARGRRFRSRLTGAQFLALARTARPKTRPRRPGRTHGAQTRRQAHGRPAKANAPPSSSGDDDPPGPALRHQGVEHAQIGGVR